jgi:hypothetical protein
VFTSDDKVRSWQAGEEYIAAQQRSQLGSIEV